MTKALVVVGSGLLVFLGADALWAARIERRRIPRVVEKFETSSKQLQVLSDEEFFPRKETTALKELSTPKPGF